MCLPVHLTGLERIATTLFSVWKCVRDATVTAAGPKAMGENRRTAVFLRFSYQRLYKPWVEARLQRNTKQKASPWPDYVKIMRIFGGGKL